METSLKMSKKHLLQVVLVVNILVCSGLSSAARERKAKCPTCEDIVEAFKKVMNFICQSLENLQLVYYILWLNIYLIFKLM